MTNIGETAANGRLDGLWAVVTGASKGIGFGIADGFVAAGANVMIAARGPDDLERAAGELRKRAGDDQEVRVARVDSADPASVEELFATIEADLPRLDIYVANAGSGIITPFVDIPLEEWDRTLALNLTGTFLGCQRAARAMIAGDSVNRAILVVSSIRGLGVRPGRLAYSVTKAGLNQLVRVAAYELAEHQIRVNALLPGITVTPMVEGNPEIFVEASASVPLGRAGEPADMAGAAVYLCGPAARFVTGVNFVVDGGESLR